MAPWHFETGLAKRIAGLRNPSVRSEDEYLSTKTGRIPDRYSNPRAIRDDQSSSDRSSNFIDTTAQSRFSDIQYEQNVARYSDCLVEDDQLANPSRSSDYMDREGLRDPARSSDIQYIDNGHASLTRFDSPPYLDEYSRRLWQPQANESTSPTRLQADSSDSNASSPRMAGQLTKETERELDLKQHPLLYVQALHDYDNNDSDELSFRQGDTISVFTQLTSGWWQGVLNDRRGWFPGHYCTILRSEEPKEDVESDTEGEDEEENNPEASTSRHSSGQLTKDDHDAAEEDLAFWVPQATPDGRLFYFNFSTGETSIELPRS